MNIINERNLKVAHRKGENGGGDFNCWGATLFVLGVNDELYWADNDEITQFIEEETEEVKDKKNIQEGDILILYYPQSTRISHSAVYISKRKLFHKVGGNESEFTSKAGVRRRYWESKKERVFRYRKAE